MDVITAVHAVRIVAKLAEGDVGGAAAVALATNEMASAAIRVAKEYMDNPSRLLNRIPNLAAIEAAFPWAGLSEGMVAQGVACHEGKIFHSIYPKEGWSAPDAVSKVVVNDAEGKPQGGFYLPSDVKHAGGMAVDQQGNILLGDTKVIYKIDTERAMKEGHCNNAVIGRRELADIRGSSIAFNPATGQIFIPEYVISGDGATGYFFDVKKVFQDAAPLTASEAAGKIRLPPAVQGAAWDSGGNFWLARSSLFHGELMRVDSITGRVLERHDTVAGVEDIDFDKNGKLWSLSETAAKPYWYTTEKFPNVFRVDMDRLRTPAAGETRALAGMHTDTAVETFCQSVVDDYAARQGLHRIDVVITRHVPSACADSGITWWAGDETIYINPDFVDKIYSPDALAGVVLHEAGHAYAQHAGYSTDLAVNHADEFQADMVAARAMDQLGFDRDEFADLLSSFGSASGTHPDGSIRAAVVRATPRAEYSAAALAGGVPRFG